MAKLVTTTCKAKIVLTHHSTSLCKGAGEGVCTQATTAQERADQSSSLPSNNDLWTLILDQMIH